MSIAAPVVKSFMFDAGASGMCGLRSATARPLSSSTIWMLASELLATEPLTSPASRSSNVRPGGIAGAAGFAATLRVAAGFFFGVGFFFFFVWPSAEPPRRVRSRTARIATGRAPGNVISAKDTFPRPPLCKVDATKVGASGLQPLPRLRQRQSNSLVQRRRQPALHAALNLLVRVAPRKVREHDQVVLETIGKVGDVVDVNVAIQRGAILMSIQDERALDQQHLGAKDRVARLENPAIGVAGVEEERPAILLIDGHAFPAQLRDGLAARAGQF